MSVHPTDDLELYALGDLEASERSSIEAHLAQCATCRRAVGEAEETLAALADALPRYRMPVRRTSSPLVGLAAAFVAGIVLAGGSLVAYEGTTSSRPSDDVRAQIAMTHAHFLHVGLDPVAAGAPAAKVIYARDRSWLYAIVDGNGAYDLVLAQPDGARRDLGRLVTHGASSSIFVQSQSPVTPVHGEEVDLVSGDRVLARGTLL